ncbi:MAG TPA: hypothetical protein VMS64_35715 [Candidatus Methylomirabilis sp.]|nr:hypothetical protein [Candidatus Methylomirabilis sp.]
MLDLIPGSTLEALAADPGVAYAAPLVFGDSYAGFPVIGSTADFVTRGGRVPVAEGRLFTSGREVVVGATVPLSLGKRFAATHGEPTSRGAGLHPRTGIALSVTITAQEISMVTMLAASGAALALIPAWRCYRAPVSAELRS